MTHYRSDLRDVFFVLFELLTPEGDEEANGGLDEALTRDMLTRLDDLARGPIAESFSTADRTPPRFDARTGEVVLDPSFVRSWQAFVDGGWAHLAVSPGLGGPDLPPSVFWAAAELVLGANPAVYIYSAGYAFASVLEEIGTEDQRRLARLMVERGWGATMVLTEAEAGSDVGNASTSAHMNEDGTWSIRGVKRFITSGEHDLSDNIVHLVLARPEGAPPGTKGLSLFCVPKRHVDLATGGLGARNGVRAVALEDKMGFTASATVELRFGEDDPALGTLVGNVHDGIRHMFRCIELARMIIAVKAMSTLSTGYRHAVEHARRRRQGSDLAAMTDATARRVPIIDHPDVRRSLMTQKAYAEGLRALILYAASRQDIVVAARRAGAWPPIRGSDADMARRVYDLLLPVAKGCASERAFALLGSETLQVFGGEGYLRDHPIEQYVRDSKIDTVYEGTTAIQALDFVFRKIVKDQGMALGWLSNQVANFASGPITDPALQGPRVRLQTALADVTAIGRVMLTPLVAASPHENESDSRAIYRVGENASRFMLAVGDLLIGWLLLREADVAARALKAATTPADRPFYAGKIAVARHFALTHLPLLSGVRAVVEAVDGSLMDPEPESF